jgi:hypothetical protein
MKLAACKIIAALFIVCLVACVKNGGSGNGSVASLSISKQDVKLGEPLFATTNYSGSNLVTRWSVSPSANAWVSSAGNKSVILFSNPGSYTITASYYPDSSSAVATDSSASPVTVNDSLYSDSTAHCNAIVTSPIDPTDVIVLTPVIYADTGLAILAHTEKSFTYQSSLGNISPVIDAGNYEFDFTDVLELPCFGNTVPAPATTTLYFGSLPTGAHTLTVLLNGTVYSGTINVTDQRFTLVWPYTSGVIMTSLVVNK